MALKLSVKIGDVTNLSDARYAAGMGVDFIGFNIDPESTHFVTPEVFNEIVNWVSGVGIIGEIGNNLPENINDFGAVLIETSNPEFSEEWKEYVLRITKEQFQLTEISEKLAQFPSARFYVIEVTPHAIINNPEELKNICDKYPIYLSTDFNEELLDIVVNHVKPTGIEIKGGLEEQPGFKDYDGIADVLEWLETD
ncbi:MAG: hypothetical protein KDC79_11750 [Cyclobacteriaceae bacterium]|nr:hypothetical protein [Cyclobacteriaceae bacterium]